MIDCSIQPIALFVAISRKPIGSNVGELLSLPLQLQTQFNKEHRATTQASLQRYDASTLPSEIAETAQIQQK